MIGPASAGVADGIDRVLNSCVGRVRRCAPMHWELPSRNGAEHEVVVRWDGHWLLFRASIRETGVPWELLQRQASLPGNVKFSAGPNRELRVQTEILAAGDFENLPAQVRWVYQGLQAALDPPIGPLAPKCSAGDAPDLRRLCMDAGWPFSERAGGRLAVPLAVTDSFAPAILEADSDGHVRVEVTLLAGDNLSAISREAISELLLGANSLIRLARTALAVHGEQVEARAEVTLMPGPTPRQLEHALAALSVATDLCAAELEALKNEAVAGNFLATTASDEPATQTERENNP